VAAAVLQGDSVDVAVTIRNCGNQDVRGGVQVALTCDPTGSSEGDDLLVIGRQTLPGGLAVGVSTTLTYTWETGDFPPDSYMLAGTHDLRDDNMANNTRGISASVYVALMDVAVAAIDSPETVFPGEPAEINVTVENVGNRDVSGNVEVVLTADNTTASEANDDLALGSQTVRGGLAAGESATLVYTWDAGGAKTGVHTVRARHDWADDDADNDSWTVTVIVAEAVLPQVIVSHVTPRVLWSGRQGSLMIRGEGFVEGLAIAFEGGDGPAPTVTSVRVLGSGSLVSRVTMPSEGLAGPTTWDVRITNPDGASGVLHDALTVRP